MIMLVVLMGVVSAWGQPKLTLGDVMNGTFAAQGLPGMTTIPGTDEYLQLSDDGKIVKYSFKTGQPVETLFDVDNTIGRKIDSFDGFELSPDGTRMLIRANSERIYRRSLKADYYIYTIRTKKLEWLSDGGKQQIPVWSPDGNQIAFVRDGNIFLIKLLYDNAESQVTKDGKFGEVINGAPDWVYEEEFTMDRALAFTSDGQMLCWLRWDESKVKTYDLQMFRGMKPMLAENADYPSLYSYKYPKAGQVNSTVTAWSYDIKSHKALKLQVPMSADGYMPRMVASGETDRVLVYTLNRHQDELAIYSVNARTTVAQQVLSEKIEKYVKEGEVTDILVGKQTILVPSDRTGFTNIYLYNLNGQLLRTVTNNKYDVTAVYGYDERTGDVYYQAASDNEHDRQLFVSHKNGKTERLSTQAGWNSASFSGDYRFFIKSWSDLNTPTVITLCDQKGKTLKTLVDNQKVKDRLKDYQLAKREMFSFTTSEGVRLDGWMVKPANFSASQKYPVIMHQYSGPASQQVVNSWSAGSMGQGGAFDYYLAQLGFIVVSVDGRGTGARGAEFEKCTYMRLGDLESKDQVEAALWLGSQSYVDKDRIGIWGWSYGGFNTLMSMSEGRPAFRAGVAVAPPTNWKFYDSIYTERYMRTPKENPEGYAINPIERAGQLHGALLICHGLADDNVHPQNTFEYSEALVQADKDFRELIYTNRNHSIYGGNTRMHLMRQIVNFFTTELK